MAFTNFTRVDDVVKKYRLTFVQAPLLPPDVTAPLFGDYFRDELTFSLRKLPVGRSEIGSGEILLFPILREVWKHYAEELALFTHEGLTFDDDLTGTPDYFVCKISEFGQTIPDVPYLLVCETKLDDFEKGWGQCAAAMLAAQRLNQTPEVPVHGIVTNGSAWQFGVLLGHELTVDPIATALSNLDTLSQRLHAVFRAVRARAIAHIRAPAR
ncbi:hypothetical protein [Fimbriiglobus ruber]|uniref:Type I restriction enzyme R protein N-terminal domain-containing protein n=1 Tax=Fimbriiglobus ruber TaxID=1908690 RepID=A0A225DZB3_9BACT|nr:hypothetical protein [Fimbriiglobus ruber]OWK41705.1 hypothetical protein FRUB_03783 [Fimbriiglobus ruber]